jgi:ferredoxin
LENGIAHVNNDKIKGNEQDCIDAAKQCPVSAIKIYE